MPTILIDSNNLVFRIVSAIPGYNHQFRSNHQINLLAHSFLNSILTVSKKIKTRYEIDDILLIWDSKTNNRKQVYPEYKANRKGRTLEEEKDRNNYFSLLNELRDSLKKLGSWTNVEVEGYEADDLIAYIVKNSDYDEQFVVVSSDNDLYQLLNERVIQYLPHKKEFYSLIDFKKEFGIEPQKYIFVKALAGDNGDNIKGIYGIGIKKAVKMFQEGKCWSSFVDKYKDVDLETNLEIIKLPFEEEGLKDFLIPKSYFDKDTWIKLFQSYGLNKLNLFDFRELLEKK